MPALGALKDPPDSRDYPFLQTRIARAAMSMALPVTVNLSQHTGPVKDQGSLGACVAFACASAREWLVRSLDANSTVEYSALYLYYRAREIMGTLGQDSGLYLRDAMKALAQWGVPQEVAWPYDESKFNFQPYEVADHTARYKRIYTYHRLDTLTPEQMKQCLSEGHPFVLSMEVFGNLVKMPLENDALILPEKAGLPSTGGHAVLVLGYYEPVKAFLAQNSWGKSWARDGFFWLPYDYVAQYAWDAWVTIS